MAKRNPAKTLQKVVAVLTKNPGGLWIREISRQSGVHMESVRRLIKKYPFIFEEYADFTPYKVNFKIIKLRNPRITPENVHKYIDLSRNQ